MYLDDYDELTSHSLQYDAFYCSGRFGTIPQHLEMCPSLLTTANEDKTLSVSATIPWWAAVLTMDFNDEMQ